jgi:hypothetical protein
MNNDYRTFIELISLHEEVTQKQNRQGRCKKGTKNADTFECLDNSDDQKDQSMTFKKAMDGSHILNNPEIQNYEKMSNELLDQRKKIETSYNDIPIDKPDLKDKLIDNLEKIDTERSHLYNKVYELQKGMIISDLEKLSPVDRIAYRDKKHEEMIKHISDMPTKNMPDAERRRIQNKIVLVSNQYYVAEEYLRIQNKSSEFVSKHKNFKNLSDAEKGLHAQIEIESNIDPKSPKVITTLNRIGKEYTKLTSKFPALQKLDIQQFSIEVRTGDAAGAWHEMGKKVSIRPDLKGIEDVTGRKIMNTFTTEFVFRHEIGHVVQSQLFTADERKSIEKWWSENGYNKPDSYETRTNPKYLRIKESVSSYAVTDPFECAAEMFGFMSAGKRVSRDIFPPAYDANERVLKGGK